MSRQVNGKVFIEEEYEQQFASIDEEEDPSSPGHSEQESADGSGGFPDDADSRSRSRSSSPARRGDRSPPRATASAARGKQPLAAPRRGTKRSLQSERQQLRRGAGPAAKLAGGGPPRGSRGAVTATRGGRTTKPGGRPPVDTDRRGYGAQRADDERTKRQRLGPVQATGGVLKGPIILDDTVDPIDRNPSGVAPATPKSMSKQWCYTLNNPTRQTVPRLRSIDSTSIPSCTYHVFQLEVGQSGTLHCQGFICFATRVRMSTVKTLLGGNPHLEIARGTPQQAADYCRDPTKRDPRHPDAVHEYGTMPPARNAGQRTDLTALQTLLDGGATSEQVARQDFPSWIRYNKSIDKYRTDFVQQPRNRKSLIFVFVGETGTGKSNAAYAFTDIFPVPPGSSGTTWFDGYDPDRHQSVLMEEFHGGRCSWTELLRLTDQYPMTVNSKGSHLQFSPEAIVFTSNSTPTEWYPNIPDKGPFLRRIDVMWEYFATDTKKLPPAVLQKFGDLAVASEQSFHSIAVCLKGDPAFHPHANRHKIFYEDEEGQKYYGVLQQPEPVPYDRPPLWE